MSAKEVIIKIDPDGTVYFMNNDDVMEIMRKAGAESFKAVRASHVELHDDGMWYIHEIFPGGEVTIHNHRPFARRADAIAYEVETLKSHLLEPTFIQRMFETTS